MFGTAGAYARLPGGDRPGCGLCGRRRVHAGHPAPDADPGLPGCGPGPGIPGRPGGVADRPGADPAPAAKRWLVPGHGRALQGAECRGCGGGDAVRRRSRAGGVGRDPGRPGYGRPRLPPTTRCGSGWKPPEQPPNTRRPSAPGAGWPAPTPGNWRSGAASVLCDLVDQAPVPDARSIHL